MTYYKQTLTVSEFITDIVTKLTAFTGVWTLIDSAYPDGYCIKNEAENTYITISKSVNFKTAKETSSRYWYAAGILLTYSTTYDTETHTPGGSISYGMIPMIFQTTYNSQVTTYGNLYLGEDHSFVFAYNVDIDGFVGIVQNPITEWTYACGAMFGLEAMSSDAREYDDGAVKLVQFVVPTYIHPTYTSVSATYSNEPDVGYFNVRPFVLGTNFPIVDTISIGAIKGSGSGNIYFKFPQIHNEPTYFRDPILISKKFIYVDNDGNIGEGDIISWLDGATTRKFRVEEATGTHSADVPVKIAIAYENIIEY